MCMSVAEQYARDPGLRKHHIQIPLLPTFSLAVHPWPLLTEHSSASVTAQGSPRECEPGRGERGRCKSTVPCTGGSVPSPTPSLHQKLAPRSLFSLRLVRLTDRRLYPASLRSWFTAQSKTGYAPLIRSEFIAYGSEAVNQETS